MNKNSNITEVLSQILDIIDFSDNKEEFINKFVDLSRQQALLNLLDSVPTNKQVQLKQELSTKKSLDEVAKEFQNIFTPQQYQEELTHTTNNLLNKYLISIMSSLSVNQRKELKALRSSLI